MFLGVSLGKRIHMATNFSVVEKDGIVYIDCADKILKPAPVVALPSFEKPARPDEILIATHMDGTQTVWLLDYKLGNAEQISRRH